MAPLNLSAVIVLSDSAVVALAAVAEALRSHPVTDLPFLNAVTQGDDASAELMAVDHPLPFPSSTVDMQVTSAEAHFSDFSKDLLRGWWDFLDVTDFDLPDLGNNGGFHGTYLPSQSSRGQPQPPRPWRLDPGPDQPSLFYLLLIG